jgi:hypothetical protein
MKQNRSSLTQNTLQALSEAVSKLVEDHRQRGKPIAVWRDGKAVWIAAEEAKVLRAISPDYQSRVAGVEVCEAFLCRNED